MYIHAYVNLYTYIRVYIYNIFIFYILCMGCLKISGNVFYGWKLNSENTKMNLMRGDILEYKY